MGLPEQQAQVLCTLAELQEADGDLVEAHTRLLEAFEQLQPLEVTDGLADIEAALARVTARQEAGVPLFDGLAGAVQLYEAWVRCPDLADGGLPPTRILHRFEPHFPICKPHHKRYVLTDPPGVQP
jgi:hypothetical protein